LAFPWGSPVHAKWHQTRYKTRSCPQYSFVPTGISSATSSHSLDRIHGAIPPCAPPSSSYLCRMHRGIGASVHAFCPGDRLIINIEIWWILSVFPKWECVAVCFRVSAAACILIATGAVVGCDVRQVPLRGVLCVILGGWGAELDILVGWYPPDCSATLTTWTLGTSGTR
jgi:hypothetical protein